MGRMQPCQPLSHPGSWLGARGPFEMHGKPRLSHPSRERWFPGRWRGKEPSSFPFKGFHKIFHLSQCSCFTICGTDTDTSLRLPSEPSLESALPWVEEGRHRARGAETRTPALRVQGRGRSGRGGREAQAGRPRRPLSQQSWKPAQLSTCPPRPAPRGRPEPCVSLAAARGLSLSWPAGTPVSSFLTFLAGRPEENISPGTSRALARRGSLPREQQAVFPSVCEAARALQGEGVTGRHRLGRGSARNRCSGDA